MNIVLFIIIIIAICLVIALILSISNKNNKPIMLNQNNLSSKKGQKYCDKCGAQLKNENSKFCEKCGSKLKFN